MHAKIFHTTYLDRKISGDINRIVGKADGWLQRLRNGRQGSARMVVASSSPKIATLLTAEHYTDFGSVELRPDGILVHLAKVHKKYSWAIPFDELKMEMSADINRGFFLRAGEDYVEFTREDANKQRAFFQRIAKAIKG